MLYLAPQWNELPGPALKAIAATDIEDAIKKMQQFTIDILILKKHASENPFQKLCRVFNYQFPNGKIIWIDDQDISAIPNLLNECILSFERKMKPIITIKDDAFEISSIAVNIQ
ncbi:MAG: hypothetical protein IPL97_07635 [Niastella sp.]|nr:hypothetical protein [Niastella sp.]